MAIASGIQLTTVFFQREIVNQRILDILEKKYHSIEFIALSKELFSKITYRESTGGIIGVAETKLKKLYDIILPNNPLIIVIEGVEKPGNLGAILRTADAAKVDAVICCELATDLYNPNIIRSSLGTVFTVPVAIASNNETMEWILNNKIKSFCTNLHNAKDYFNQDFRQGSAIIVGTEATGVSEEWIKFSDANIKIPMLGEIDSMNVSVATAILVYEAVRQRMSI